MAEIISMRCVSSGAYEIIVEQAYHYRKYPYITSSVTHWHYIENCMPLIDEYRREGTTKTRMKELEQHFISKAKRKGLKTRNNY